MTISLFKIESCYHYIELEYGLYAYIYIYIYICHLRLLDNELLVFRINNIKPSLDRSLDLVKYRI
jgi:hypothetical protein